MKLFRRIFNGCFGVKNCLLHRALARVARPCQLVVETYGLDVNHKDSIGQTCSSTAISRAGLWTCKQIDARKTFVDVQKCRECVLKCVCVCPVHSCKFGIRWFWWRTSFISTSWKGRAFLILDPPWIFHYKLLELVHPTNMYGTAVL